MAFLLKGNSFYKLRSHSQEGDDLLSQSRRGLHVAPGPDEQAKGDNLLSQSRRGLHLLAEDPLLSLAKTLLRVGGVLTAVVIAGICYEIYVNRRFVARQQTVAKALEWNRDKTLECSVSFVHVGRDGTTIRFIRQDTDAMNQAGLEKRNP